MKRFFLLCEIFLLFSAVASATGGLTTGGVLTGVTIQEPLFMTGELITGGVLDEPVPSMSYALKITEVYYDGHDERIEIYNEGEGSFSGTLTIDGAKSASLVVPSVVIPGGEVLMLVDKIDTFTQDNFLVLSGLGLNIPDTKEIAITLRVEETVQDSFFVSQQKVQEYNDEKGSFYQGIYDDTWHIAFSMPEQAANILSLYSAHPGVVISIESAEDIILEEVIVCPAATGNVLLSEIHLGSQELSTYIEIYFAQQFSGNLFFTGSSLVSSFFLDISSTIYPGDYLIVTDDQNFFNNDQNIIEVDNLLLASGILQVSGQNGQVLDNTLVELQENTSVYYVSRDGEECHGRTQSHHQPTPGFNQNLLEYIDTTPTIVTGAICGEDEENEGPIPVMPVVDISIRGIVAAPLSGDESLTLRLDRGPAILDLSGYYILKGSVKRYLHGTLQINTPQVIEQNYGFSNTNGGCVTLHEPNGGQLDDICYTKDQVSGLIKRAEGEDNENITGTQALIPMVEIVSIEYDPPGSDVGREMITLRNLNTMIFEAKDLWLQVGERSSKTYINQELSGGTSTDFTANFRFPNQDTCVLLMHQQSVLDIYCYTTQSATASNSQSKATTHPKVKLEIVSVDYDPDGTDTHRESVTIRYVEGEDSVLDLQDFRLLVGKQKKTLPATIPLRQEATITKTFGLPNTKVTCVTLLHDDKAYDVWCYDPKESTEEESKITHTPWGEGEQPEIEILNIVYDPDGRDEERESISIMSLASGTLSSSGFSVDIDGKNKNLNTQQFLQPHQPMVFTGTFGFLNAGACVSLMYQSYLFDTVCYGDALDDLMMTAERGIKGDLSIQEVNYNPEGKDEGNETITLLYSGTNAIDLSDVTMTVNDQKRSLQGVLTPGVRTTLQANYRFPNTAACIQLWDGSEIIAKHCYDPSDDDSGETTQQPIISGAGIEIVDVVYNPPGSDTNRESLLLLFPSATEIGDLRILHKGKKYGLGSGKVETGQTLVFQGTYNFPNRVGCIDLLYKERNIDRYCYHDGFGDSSGQSRWLEDVASEVVEMFNTITLRQEADDDCIVYQGHSITCKTNKKVKAFASHDKFYTSYIQSMHDYLYYSWPVLYYHTDMRQYMKTYRAALKQVRNNQETITIGTREYPTTDFETIMADQYIDSYYEWFIQGVESLTTTGQSTVLSNSD